MSDHLSLRRELAGVRDALDGLAVEKRATETELSTLRDRLRTTMPKAEYRECCGHQNKLVKKLLEIERAMAGLKSKMRELCNLEHEQYVRETNGDKVEHTKPIVSELVALRQHYQEFAADSTRVSSMRSMAADFVLKLNPIIRKAVGTV